LSDEAISPPGFGDTAELPVPPEAHDDDEWPIRGPAGGVRLAVPTAVLVAALLIAGGFWGGAALEKSHASSSGGGGGVGGAAALARLRSAFGATGATGATGASGAAGAGSFLFGGGGSGATVGTVSVVDGDTLYVVTSSGGLVKVTLDSSTTVTRNAKAQAVELRPGDTVIVQGAAAKNGDVTATSVSATAPGVSSGGGLGGLFNRGGGGFNGGSGATGTSGSAG
jgi:Domain of unknown function (DUF5666)